VASFFPFCLSSFSPMFSRMPPSLLFSLFSFFLSLHANKRERETHSFFFFSFSLPFHLFFSFSLLSSRRTQIIFFLQTQIFFFSSSSLSLSCCCFVFIEEPRSIAYLQETKHKTPYENNRKEERRAWRILGIFFVLLSGPQWGGYPLPKYFQTCPTQHGLEEIQPGSAKKTKIWALRPSS
jgi:hypothetical protein